MTQHLACFEAMGGHLAATSGMQSERTMSVTTGTLALTAAGRSTQIPQPSIPLSCHPLASSANDFSSPGALFFGQVLTDVPDNACLQASGDSEDKFWAVDGAFADNNSLFPITDDEVTGIESRNCTRKVFVLSGAALTAAKSTGDVVSMSGTMQWAYPKQVQYEGLTHFCEFEDRPNDSVADGTEVLTRIKRELQNAGAEVNLGPDIGGTDVIVRSCNYTALAPDAVVYVAPTDLGEGVGQIPAAVTSNTAENFRYHPSVFMRRQTYVRSLARRYADAAAVNAGGVRLAVRIMSVTTAPVISQWLLVFDGVPMVVQINQTGTDIRRPRDIWNHFIAPLINGNSDIANAPFLQPSAGSELRGPGNTQLRWKNLDYARCLNIVSTGQTQTGSSPA